MTITTQISPKPQSFHVFALPLQSNRLLGSRAGVGATHASTILHESTLFFSERSERIDFACVQEHCSLGFTFRRFPSDVISEAKNTLPASARVLKQSLVCLLCGGIWHTANSNNCQCSTDTIHIINFHRQTELVVDFQTWRWGNATQTE